MQIHEIRQTPSIFNHFIEQIRDEKIQKDSMRFRTNLERMGEIFAYEISKELNYVNRIISTPLGEANENLIDESLVIATILRAGLPLHQGVLNYFDSAENAFISAYRKSKKGDDFEIEIEYLSSPSIDGKTLILTDTMLATGSSIVLAYKAMLQKGKPKYIHVVSCIASSEGIDFVKQNLPKNTHIWVGAIDEELTAQAYIVPGLGDAGDLAYGKKD